MAFPAVGTNTTQAIRPRRTFAGHAGEVRGVIHLPGRQRIMTCSHDGSLRIWNLQSGEQIGDDWRDGESQVSAIALSPDWKRVVSGSIDGAVKLWGIDTGKVITEWTGHTSHVRSVRWTQDGGQVLSASSDETARVWDVERGETILVIKTGFEAFSAIYSPDETVIATGGYNEEEEYIKIFDAKTGKLAANVKGHTWTVGCLAWTADGTTLISGSADESIRMWNTTTWQQINVLTGHTNLVYDIAISPNGRILASASQDHTARLWNFENGQPIASPLQHSKTVRYASFSTDGKLLVTGCHDSNSYTWDVSAIVRESGLDELLLNPNDGHKSLPEADAIRLSTQRRRRDNINPNRPLPPGFFDDSPRYPPPSRRRALSPSSARQHHVAGHLSSNGLTLLGRLSSLFRLSNYHTQDAPPGTRLSERAQNLFSRKSHRHDEGIELQDRRSAAVDVPLAKGKPRNYSARELLMKRKREKEKAMAAKNASSGSSHPPQSDVTQQSGGVAQGQLSSELHAAVATSSTTHAVVSTFAVSSSTTSLPNAMIPRAGRWTRFWLFVCCASAQYTNGHH